MAVTLKKLKGDAIPAIYRQDGEETVFQVVDVDGKDYFYRTEEEAAAQVVALSEENKRSS